MKIVWKKIVKFNYSVEIYGFDVEGMRIIRYLHASKGVYRLKQVYFQFHCLLFYAISCCSWGLSQKINRLIFTWFARAHNPSNPLRHPLQKWLNLANSPLAQIQIFCAYLDEAQFLLQTAFITQLRTHLICDSNSKGEIEVLYDCNLSATEGETSFASEIHIVWIPINILFWVD